MGTFRLSAAKNDVSDGLQLWPIWMRFAIDDLRLRYQRTRLGPTWLMIGIAFWIGGLGIIWGTLLNVDLYEFFPYMAVGLVLWQALSAAINEGTSVFVTANSIISAIPLPLTLHINRQVLRILITLLHTLPVALVVTFWFGDSVSWVQLLAIPGLALLIPNFWWATLLLGIIGLRYRDFGQAVSMVMPFMFFCTPILWQADMLGPLAIIAKANPFTYFIEVVRQPLIGHVPSVETYVAVLLMTVVGCIGSVLLFSRIRHRIAFWV